MACATLPGPTSFTSEECLNHPLATEAAGVPALDSFSLDFWVRPRPECFTTVSIGQVVVQTPLVSFFADYKGFRVDIFRRHISLTLGAGPDENSDDNTEPESSSYGMILKASLSWFQKS